MTGVTLEPNCNYLEKEAPKNPPVAKGEVGWVKGRVSYVLSGGQVFFVENTDNAPYGVHECLLCGKKRGTIPQNNTEGERMGFLCNGCYRIDRVSDSLGEKMEEIVWETYGDDADFYDLEFETKPHEILFEFKTDVRLDTRPLEEALEPLFRAKVKIEFHTMPRCVSCEDPMDVEREGLHVENGIICDSCLQHDYEEPHSHLFKNGEDEGGSIGKYHNDTEDTFTIDDNDRLQSESFVQVSSPTVWEDKPEVEMKAFGTAVEEVLQVRGIEYYLDCDRGGHPRSGSDYELWVEIGHIDEVDDMLDKMAELYLDPGRYIPGIETQDDAYDDEPREIEQDILEASVEELPKEFAVTDNDGELIARDFPSEEEAIQWRDNLVVSFLQEGWPDRKKGGD